MTSGLERRRLGRTGLDVTVVGCGGVVGTRISTRTGTHPDRRWVEVEERIGRG
jgi:hypothetical protein